MNRREVLIGPNGVTTAALAGCSGDDDNASDDPSENPDDPPEQTDEAADSPPTLEEFAYPSSAALDGVTSSRHYNTHELTLTETRSFTIGGVINQTTDRWEQTIEFRNKFASEGIFRREEDQEGLTKTIWSSSTEQEAVQIQPRQSLSN